MIHYVAPTEATVLVTGESGTGKELVAKAIHANSPRSDKPFVVVHAAAVPENLLESELFGYEKGAFTGASAQRIGKIEHANGGTLFLDEIGDMPAELQTRLLRVLADGVFYPVGAHTPRQVDVRIIAATHQDLEQRVRDGLFREIVVHDDRMATRVAEVLADTCAGERRDVLQRGGIVGGSDDDRRPLHRAHFAQLLDHLRDGRGLLADGDGGAAGGHPCRPGRRECRR